MGHRCRLSRVDGMAVATLTLPDGRVLEGRGRNNARAMRAVLSRVVEMLPDGAPIPPEPPKQPREYVVSMASHHPPFPVDPDPLIKAYSDRICEIIRESRRQIHAGLTH